MRVTAAGIADDVRRGRRSPTEVVEDTLAAIHAAQPRLNAFITVMDDAARAQARALERRLARGEEPGPLAGVPVAVKDLLLTKDAPTTAGSRIHGEGIPPQPDADVVRHLRRAGAIIIGKASLHEVALGVTNVNEHFGAARNPWNPAHVSGGSSGGSAVAVAAGLVPLAVGTDTRGSIRIPAACCGITGFKPTRGLLPLGGVLPLAPTMDHVGPMAGSVADLRRMLAAMGPRRPATIDSTGGTRSLTIGVPTYHLRGTDAAMRGVVDAAIETLRPMVRAVRPVEMPGLDGVQEASTVIAASEALAGYHEALQENPSGFGPIVRERLEGGYRRSAVEYLHARWARDRAIAAFARVFAEVDLLVAPTVAGLPPRIGDQVVMVNGSPVGVVDAFTWCNAPQSMAGVPALTIPAGMVSGFPAGLQVIGPLGGDGRVLALGAAWQRETTWHLATPDG